MSLFSLIIVYHNNASFTSHGDDLDDLMAFAKQAIDDDTVSFVQVSGEPFGPSFYMARSFREPNAEPDLFKPAMELDLPKGVYWSPARGLFGSMETDYRGIDVFKRYDNAPDAWTANKQLFPAPPDETNYALNKAMQAQTTPTDRDLYGRPK